MQSEVLVTASGCILFRECYQGTVYNVVIVVIGEVMLNASLLLLT